jgi:hypothetical protein
LETFHERLEPFPGVPISLLPDCWRVLTQLDIDFAFTFYQSEEIKKVVEQGIGVRQLPLKDKLQRCDAVAEIKAS